MSDKAIILSVILAAVLCVAVPFIFRVCRYRRRMKALIVPDTSAFCGCLSPVTST